MSQFIYISKFPASPEATERQQTHFEADVNFAYSEGYSFIESSDNLTFQIVSPTELVEVDVTEEQLQAVEENLQKLAEESTPLSMNESIGKSKHTLTGDSKLDGPFFRDVAKCHMLGLGVIEDAKGHKYTVNSATSVTSILTEETDTKDDYCIQCHNLMLIDQIINNTLLQEGKLTTDSCDNMLRLAHLKSVLGGC